MSRRKQLKPQSLNRRPSLSLQEPQNDSDERLSLASSLDHLSSSYDAPSPETGPEMVADSASTTSDTSDEKSERPDLADDFKRYRCSFCQKRCISLTQLKEHEQVHADLMPYRCRHCGKGFKHKRSQDRHEHLHTGYKKHKCKHCDAAFFRSDHLKLHLKTHEAGRRSEGNSPSVTPHDCSVCDSNFETAEQLLQHLDDEHGVLNGIASGVPATPEKQSAGLNRLYTCGMCYQMFSDTTQLQKHTLEKHSVQDLNGRHSSASFEINEDPRYGCQYCSQSFESILALHEHTTNGHPDADPNSGVTRTYVCSQCNKGLSSLAAFSAHMRQHITNDKEASSSNSTSFQCDFCGVELGSSADLLEHSVQHYLQKECSYSCSSCTAKHFGAPDELQKHLLELHALQLFRCSLCKELFDSRVDIQVHFAVVHSHERVQWRCRACNAAFHTADQFHFHVDIVHLRGGGGKTIRPTPQVQPQAAPVYCCKDCNRMFSSERAYAEHCASHNAPFRCRLCGETFSVEFLFERHMNTEHNSLASLQITSNSPIGEQTPFVHTAALTRPMPEPSMDGLIFAGTFDDPNMIKCNVCDQKYDTVQALAQHKLQHCKVLQSGVCHLCGTEMNSLEQFYAHIRQHNAHNGPPVSCVVCRQSLLAPIEVQTHARFHLFLNCVEKERSSSTVSGGRKSVEECMGAVQCDMCPVKCETAEDLKKHEQSAHVKPFQCIKCQRWFATEAEIRTHVASHVMHDGFEHHCLLCQQVFDSPSKLQCHLIEHSFAGCTEYQCYLCGLVFSLPQPLQKHMLTHSQQERPYDCDKCDQQFFFRAELENHTLMHGRNACDTKSEPSNSVSNSPVSKVCSSPASRDSPKTTQNVPLDNKKEGDFPCPHCPKAFNSLSALQGHSHVHMTNRVHQCHKCDKSFATAAKLRNHHRKHAAAGKPFSCEACGRLFSRKDNLKVHMRSHATCAEETLPTMVIPTKTEKNSASE